MRLAESEIMIAEALIGKSDEVFNVYSRPGKIGVIVAKFLNGRSVEIEVRA